MPCSAYCDSTGESWRTFENSDSQQPHDSDGVGVDVVPEVRDGEDVVIYPSLSSTDHVSWSRQSHQGRVTEEMMDIRDGSGPLRCIHHAHEMWTPWKGSRVDLSWWDRFLTCHCPWEFASSGRLPWLGIQSTGEHMIWECRRLSDEMEILLIDVDPDKFVDFRTVGIALWFSYCPVSSGSYDAA